VRRPTGGRAVLHQGDLTYGVVTSGLNGSRIQMYEKICEFLIQGWRSLDVELHYGTAGRGYIHNPNCFGTATSADLVTVDNCKLIGSAQLRRGKAILQHGSIRLQPNAQLFATVFGAESFTSVQLPQNLTMESIIAALVAAAIDCFNIQLVLQPLSEDECKQILAK
jgi:lipoate-protein ligase A